MYKTVIIGTGPANIVDYINKFFKILRETSSQVMCYRIVRSLVRPCVFAQYFRLLKP